MFDKRKPLHGRQAGNMVAGSNGFIGPDQKKAYMLSDREELFVQVEGSADFSNAVNIQNAGLKDQFILLKKDELFEFSYSTEIYLASKCRSNVFCSA